MTKLLLDTHTFLWWTAGSSMLTPIVSDRIEAGDEVFVSPITLWEVVIKNSTNQPIVEVPDLQQWFVDSIAASGFLLLPIELRHIAAVQFLPMHHRDPFDRLLVSQAIVEGMSIVSNDRVLRRYDVSLVWDEQN